ncbi:hypothetical protein BDZ89DRAFT_1057773 [Hymenopellis radicata]|nr:hypothetical protein BDZ89DRAFT_1057773 [Hymenopellis radicata]
MSSPSPTATPSSPTAVDGSPAPAHAHDVSAEAFLAGLRLQIEREYPASEYVVTTPASWDVYLELVQSLDELRENGTLRSLRCSYLSGFILVEYVPTESHEYGHRGLIDIILGAVYTDMTLKGEQVGGLFCLFGGATFQNMGQRRGLEGDSALSLNATAQNGPTLIIECGGSQSYPSLHKKGMAWFAFPNVEVVILVNLHKVTKTKAVKVEIFQRLAAAAIPNAVNTAAAIDDQRAQYRTDEAAAGVEIFMSLAFSSCDVDQIVTPILIPYAGLFGNNIPTWAPQVPGNCWTVRASPVARWAQALMESMEY